VTGLPRWQRLAILAQVILASAPNGASGQGLNGSPPGGSSGTVIGSYGFATQGCLVSGTGQVAFERWTPATYVDAGGVLRTCAADWYRVDATGIILEEDATNVATHSLDLSSGSAAVAPWTLSSATVSTTAGFIDGTSNWATVAGTDSVGQLYQIVTAPSGKDFTASAWVRMVSGTGTAGVGVSCRNLNVVTYCGCARSDGGACTAYIDSAGGYTCTAKVADLTTTPIRLFAFTSCTNAKTDPVISLRPGSYDVSAGTAMYGGAQMEVGLKGTSFYPTTTAAATRYADNARVPTSWAKKWFASGAFATPGNGWSAAVSGTSMAADATTVVSLKAIRDVAVTATSAKVSGGLKSVKVCTGSAACKSSKTGMVGGSAPKVVCMGDSLTAPGHLALGYRTFPDLLRVTRWKNYTFINYGVGGYTTAQILSTWNTTAKNETGVSWVTVFGGYNDLAGASSAATIAASLTDIAGQAKALGYGVAIIAMTPCNSCDQVKRAAINVILSDYATAQGLQFVNANATLDAGDGTIAPAYSYGDGIHLNEAGQQVLANAVGAVLP
jgi:lysophospholipase L1-like esterase